MWLLALIGCAEHVFGSRVTDCSDLTEIHLTSPRDLDVSAWSDPTAPCSLRTDATVRTTQVGGVLTLDGVAWAELTGGFDDLTVEVAFTEALDVASDRIEADITGAGVLTASADALDVDCTGCSGTLDARIPVDANLGGSDLTLCGDAGGRVQLHTASDIGLGVGSWDPWTVEGEGTFVLTAPLGFDAVTTVGSVVQTDRTTRDTDCFGAALPIIEPDPCEDAAITCTAASTCGPECSGCGYPCPSEVSASITVDPYGIGVALDAPDGTYDLGVFAWTPGDSDIHLGEACIDPGFDLQAWLHAQFGISADVFAEGCHGLTPGTNWLTWSPQGSSDPSTGVTAFSSASAPLTFVLRDRATNGCWTGGAHPQLYQAVTPDCLDTLSVDVVPPTPSVQLFNDGTELVVLVDGLSQPLAFGAIEHGDDDGGYAPYSGEDCVFPNVCHPMEPWGGTLVRVGSPGDVVEGSSTWIQAGGETKSWLLRDLGSNACWAWGAHPESWDALLPQPCSLPVLVDTSSP